jgi:hypothetical protein
MTQKASESDRKTSLEGQPGLRVGYAWRTYSETGAEQGTRASTAPDCLGARAARGATAARAGTANRRAAREKAKESMIWRWEKEGVDGRGRWRREDDAQR